MSDIAISVRGLGKEYRVGRGPSYHTFRDALANLVRWPTRLLNADPTANGDGRFWALRDVSFDVNRGEVVGVIGRNGAGKSTLLKILSRVTEPTAGEVDLYGRVGSLLEVGTGFNPELTGRENINLNGAILGMRRAEIARKFDEIVAFAEVEKFIDTPVKHYSSGMYMRLAFAVAAHLEPEILIIDEVLAVGDAQFQKKCLGKMSDVAKHGRTVLFVSHNMQAVQQLCTQGLVLNRGEIVRIGAAADCIAFYSGHDQGNLKESWQRQTEAPSAQVSIQTVCAVLAGQQPDHELRLDISLRSTPPHNPAFLAVDVLDSSGFRFMQAIPTVVPFISDDRELHHLRVVVELPPLIPGSYSASIWVGSHNTQTFDFAESCVRFQIETSPTAGRTFPHHPANGLIVPKSRLETE
ncbi:MAG: ABC transporter ATP-binding protein [Gemmataceae bacterium]